MGVIGDATRRNCDTVREPILPWSRFEVASLSTPSTRRSEAIASSLDVLRRGHSAPEAIPGLATEAKGTFLGRLSSRGRATRLMSIRAAVATGGETLMQNTRVRGQVDAAIFVAKLRRKLSLIDGPPGDPRTVVHRDLTGAVSSSSIPWHSRQAHGGHSHLTYYRGALGNILLIYNSSCCERTPDALPCRDWVGLFPLGNQDGKMC